MRKRVKVIAVLDDEMPRRTAGRTSLASSSRRQNGTRCRNERLVFPGAGRSGEGLSVLLKQEGKQMLWTVVVILLVLWLLGFTVLHLGSLIHLLLVIALVVVVVRLIQGRRVV